MRVLITGAGTATAISVLKGLRHQTEIPVHVVMADAEDHVAGRYLADEFVRIPPASDDAFLIAVQTICQTLDIDLLIPIVDYEFMPLARSAGDFRAMGTTVAISSPSAISICDDKLLLADFLQGLGLPVAKIYGTDEAPDGRAEFPLFVKPRSGGRASLGAQKVDDLEALRVALRGLDDPLIQEFIDGDEYTVDVLSDFDGRFVAAMPRIRLETKSGVSVKGRTVDDLEFVSLARTITEALPIIGHSNVQLFRTPDGSTVVSEINPRYSGGFALSLAAGFNSPLLLLKLLKALKLAPSDLSFRYNVSMVRYWQEIIQYGDGTVLTDPAPLHSRQREVVAG